VTQFIILILKVGKSRAPKVKFESNGEVVDVVVKRGVEQRLWNSRTKSISSMNRALLTMDPSSIIAMPPSGRFPTVLELNGLVGRNISKNTKGASRDNTSSGFGGSS
jgi:hypothetical protein